MNWTRAAAADRALERLMETETFAASDSARKKSANLRTALVFASIAVAFFFGAIAMKFMGSPTTGLGVMGGAVLLFLVIAIASTLRK
jgi:small neutral amino acid transporter SnatA (MarC family)